MKIKQSLNKISYRSLLNADARLCLKVNSLAGIKIVDRLSYIVSKLGDGSVYFVVLILLIFAYRKPFILTFRDYILAQSINLIFYKLIKNKVRRARPFTSMEAITKLIPPPDEFSFPSGHSGSAAVFCICTFFHFPILSSVFTFIWMLMIGFSRVYNGVHYPGDVIVGYIMGTIIAKYTLFLLT